MFARRQTQHSWRLLVCFAQICTCCVAASTRPTLYLCLASAVWYMAGASPVALCSRRAQDILAVQGVLQAILTVMGLTKANVNDADTLSRLGIDSMQMVEVSILVPACAVACTAARLIAALHAAAAALLTACCCPTCMQQQTEVATPAAQAAHCCSARTYLTHCAACRCAPSCRAPWGALWRWTTCRA